MCVEDGLIGLDAEYKFLAIRLRVECSSREMHRLAAGWPGQQGGHEQQRKMCATGSLQTGRTC